MKSGHKHSGVILFIVNAFIFLSFIASFAGTTTYQYDDVNRMIRVERGTPDYVPTPSNLTATAISSSQINLSWTDNSTNETGFKIERKTGSGGTYAQIATPAANTTTYPDTGLTSNTTYYYRVRAYNAAGDSGYSNEANATTQTQTCTNPYVRIIRTQPLYYSTLQAAYNAAVNGDIIQSQAVRFTENLTVNKNIAVTLDGGYNCDFVTNSGSTTLIKGMITTTAGGGTITIKNFVLEK